MKKPKLEIKEKDKKNLSAHCIDKRDPKSPPSTFDAEVVYFPETEEDTQTFSVKINIIAYKNGTSVGNKMIEDEFDTKKEATKWIKKEFKAFSKLL